LWYTFLSIKSGEFYKIDPIEKINIAFSQRRFVISPYFTDRDGQLRPEYPLICPYQTPDHQACKVSLDHWRDRKTGPCFALSVMRCGVHRKGFTIYPPGHVPYGQKAVAPVAPDGSWIEAGSGAKRFVGTCFDAALDAADNHPWPHTSYDGNLHLRFRTQLRHLDRLTLLLAIKPDIDEYLRDEAANILSVPGQVLHDSAGLVQGQSSYRTLGTAICSVLETIPETTTLFERIAEAGAVATLWPAPCFWDCQHQMLKTGPFRRVRSRASP
jgi:hypothetical protein